MYFVIFRNPVFYNFSKSRIKFQSFFSQIFSKSRNKIFEIYCFVIFYYRGRPESSFRNFPETGFLFTHCDNFLCVVPTGARIRLRESSERVATPRYLACLITPSETGDRADQRCEFGTFWNVFEKIYTFPGSRKFTHRFPRSREFTHRFTRSRKFTPTESKCSKIMIFACQLQFGISSLLRGVIS